MKLSAISQRGAARDFWDLHELLGHGLTLPGCIDAYRRKHPGVDVGHVLRSLVYFGDADSAPLPKGLTEARWDSIRSAFEARVRSLGD